MTLMPPPVKPPDDIPAALKDEVDKLSKASQVLLTSKQIPWIVQAKMGEQGYTTLEDLADRWDTAEQARTQGPAQLEFTAGTNDFTQAITDFTAMRFYQAVKAAKSMASSPGAGTMITPSLGKPAASAAGLEGVVDRRTMEETYMKAFLCTRPKLEYQGSDSLLKRQFRYIAKGELGFIQVKHLVSALPEEGERPTKTSKRFTLDGWEGHEEEEIRSNPSTRRQLERMHMVFRTTLLMCTAFQPQFANLAITKQDLDDWYDWFYGEDIAGRYPPPTETTLMYAERNAWRKIHDLVHGGESLVEAMKNIKTDLLFWTREVYERVTKAAAKGHTAKGKGKTKNTSRPALSVYQPQWEKPRKGDQKGSPPKGGGKTQSKGQTKGKPDWPAHWAFRNPKQVSYCRDFHLYKTLPPRLQERLKWQQVDTSQVTTPVILLLYSGKDDAGSLDACIHAYHPHLSPHVISVDNRREPGSIGNDMLQDHPYNLFCSLACQGQILLVCGGPNCRTWSILRWFPKPNAWGLEALTDQAQSDVDDDSILMLRQFYLTSLTYQTSPTHQGGLLGRTP